MKKTYCFILTAVVSFYTVNILIAQDYLTHKVFGSSGAEFIHGANIDVNGDMVIGGTFQNTIDMNLDKNEAAFLTASSKYDIYIAKYDVMGNYKWAFNIGGASSGYNYIKNLDTDKHGNIYIIGMSSSWIDMDPSEGDAILNEEEQNMFFIAKFNSSGEYIWSHGFGNDQVNGSLIGWGIVADNLDESIYVCGNINDTIDFDPSESELKLKPQRYSDIFLAKYTKDGNVVWANIFSHSESGHGTPVKLQIDESQNVYIGGYYQGKYDMDPGEGDNTINSVGQYDGFIAKYNKEGEHQWSFSIGDKDVDYVRNFRVLNNKVYTMGEFSDTVDFDPSEGTQKLMSIENEVSGYLAVYGLDGALISAFGLKGTMGEYQGASSCIKDIDFDPEGKLYITGYFNGDVDFDSSSEGGELSSTGGYSDFDMFIAKYDAERNLEWAQNAGGTNQEKGFFVNITDSGNAVVSGYYDGTCDFDPSVEEAWSYNSGSHDVFLTWYYAFTPEVQPSVQKDYTDGTPIKIFPNPAYSNIKLLNIEDECEIEIFDLTGKPLMIRRISYVHPSMDISNLKSGGYIVKITTNSTSICRRLIVLN